MAAKELPARPNLDQYRKQAKDLVKGYHAGDPDALSRITRYHPQFKKTASLSQARVFQLADAQWVIAREHGFESWPGFASHVREIAARGSDAVAAPQSALAVAAIDLDIKTDEVYTCVFARDGRRAITGAQGNPVRVWDVETGRCVMTFEDGGVDAWAVSWSHDERDVFVGGRDGAVQMWNVQSRRCSQVLRGHHGFVRCLSAGTDGRHALSGSGQGDHTVRLWDVEAARSLRIMEGHSDGVYDVAADAAERRALSGSRDATVRLWDLDTGRCRQVFKGHSYHVHSVLWSADERRVLSSSRDIRLWDVESGRCLRTFGHEHSDTIRRVAWSADQRRALSASHDGMVRLWDVDTGRCLRVFEGHPVGVVTVAWGANERRAYSCDWNGGIRAWDLT